MFPKVSVVGWERISMTLTKEEGDFLRADQGFGSPRWSLLFKAWTREGRPVVEGLQMEEVTWGFNQNPAEYVSTGVGVRSVTNELSVSEDMGGE